MFLFAWRRLETVAQKCSVKTSFRDFAKFTGKHQCQSLAFSEVAGLRPATLFKKDSDTGALLWIFDEIFKNTFSYRAPPVAVLEDETKVKLSYENGIRLSTTINK